MSALVCSGAEGIEIVNYHQEVAQVDKISPIHPGEVLLEEFIEPLGLTQHQVAVAVGVPPRRINETVHGKRRITADTALRLARYFGTTDLFWINLQSRHDLEIERIQPAVGLTAELSSP